MGFENVGGRQTHYGALESSNRFGAEKAGAGSIKELVLDIDFSNLPTLDAGNDMLAVVPAGAIIKSATLEITVPFAGGTSIAVGITGDPDGLITASQGATANIDAVGDYITGTGAEASDDYQATDVQISAVAVGTYTAGEGKLIVSYQV